MCRRPSSSVRSPIRWFNRPESSKTPDSARSDRRRAYGERVAPRLSLARLGRRVGGRPKKPIFTLVGGRRSYGSVIDPDRDLEFMGDCTAPRVSIYTSSEAALDQSNEAPIEARLMAKPGFRPRRRAIFGVPAIRRSSTTPLYRFGRPIRRPVRRNRRTPTSTIIR